MTTPSSLSPYFVEQDFLDLVDRVFPEWYVEPLKTQGPGYELIVAYAAVFARVSLAIARTQDSLFVATALGGAPSVGTVLLSRPTTGTGSFTVLAGSVFKASRSNRYYVLQADVAFGALDLQLPASVASMGRGAELDVPGQFTTADGTVLPGEIDTVVLPMTDPVFADPALAVSQVDALSGGSAAALDQLGADRGIDRTSGEVDPPYRARVGKLPDTVSPAGIRRQLDAAFLSRGLPYELIETWQHAYTSCWDAPLGDVVHPQQGTMLEGTLAWDDPRTDRVAGLWLGHDDCPSGYALVIPNIPCLEDRGMVWDDPSDSWQYQRTEFGQRSDSVWDGPVADSSVYSAGCWDGADAARSATLASIWALFKSIKGAGVSVAFIMAGTTQAALAVPVTYPPLP